MWISTVHIVIIYFCVSPLTADTRLKFEPNHRKSLVKRSVDAYDNYYRYSNNKYNSFSAPKLRHQSRFPNLDKVMTRIDNMRLGSYDEYEKSKPHNKLRHRSWYEKKTTSTTTTTEKADEDFENYFDDDRDNNEEDDDNWDYEGDNEYDDYEDDDLFSDNSQWQAEEATEKPTTPAPVYKQMSKFGQLKWAMYGTRQNVAENRDKELNSGKESSAISARNHYMRVNSQWSCRKPLPKVISVQNEHPDPSRTYTPQCTVLHRCAEDTGCCSHNNMRCGPKTQEEVHLYFYAKTLGTLQSKVEKLTFWNHTECTCVDKAKSEEQNIETKIQYKSGEEARSKAPENITTCICPVSFIPKQRYESHCTCNCEGSNPDCERKRNGQEYFSYADRKCVLEKKCGIPICEFGAFIRQKGRCPRKQEKLEAFAQLNID